MQSVFMAVLWCFAFFGFIQMCKNILVAISSKGAQNDAVVIIKVRNQENDIEGIIRSIVWKCIGRNPIIPNILVVDLDSTDDTPNILKRLATEYEFIKVTNKQGYIDYLLECENG